MSKPLHLHSVFIFVCHSFFIHFIVIYLSFDFFFFWSYTMYIFTYIRSVFVLAYIFLKVLVFDVEKRTLPCDRLFVQCLFFVCIELKPYSTCC